MIFFPDEEQLIGDEDNTITNSNKETDIPSTIDFQPKSFNQSSPFPYQQIKQKTVNTNRENQSDIHDYDNYINPEDTPIPMTDTISAHNHEKTINFSSVKMIYLYFLKILLKES